MNYFLDFSSKLIAKLPASPRGGVIPCACGWVSGSLARLSSEVPQADTFVHGKLRAGYRRGLFTSLQEICGRASAALHPALKGVPSSRHVFIHHFDARMPQGRGCPCPALCRSAAAAGFLL